MSQGKKETRVPQAADVEQETEAENEDVQEVPEEETVEPVKEGSPEEELEDVRRQLMECKDQLLRMAADFDNTKKRLVREREITLKYAEENILKDLLPGLDNLERAMEQGKDTDNVASLLEGLELTKKGLLGTLEKFGVKPVNSVGEPFDPNLHEAISMEASAEVPEKNVLREFQKGYFYKDRLLRAAKVVVSSGDSSKDK